jgi:hypothetical protein
MNALPPIRCPDCDALAVIFVSCGCQVPYRLASPALAPSADLTPEAFLDLFRWQPGRDRQRADAWAGYMQDVLGHYGAQVAALQRLSALAPSAAAVMDAALHFYLSDYDVVEERAFTDAVEKWQRDGRPGWRLHDATIEWEVSAATTKEGE